MKKIIIGAVAAAAMIGGFATMAEAKVHIYLGVPYYSYQAGPGYLYNDDYGWYQPRHRRHYNNFYTYNQFDDGYYGYDGYDGYPHKKRHHKHWRRY